MSNASLRWFSVAGLCGGLAEVAWVGLYSLMSHTSLVAVGRGVSATIWSASVDWPGAAYLGLVIHLLLSLLLAIALGAILHRWLLQYHNRSLTMLTAVTMLAIVWKINFYFVLPIWNPSFVNLLPMGVTLISKLLFGLSMGWVLTRTQRA